MYPEDEARILKLLSNVERQEGKVVERPTGTFIRQFIFDGSDKEQTVGNDEDDDDFGILQEIRSEISDEDQQLEELNLELRNNFIILMTDKNHHKASS